MVFFYRILIACIQTILITIPNSLFKGTHMNKQAALWFIVMAPFLTGCAQYWYQEGKTFQQCQQDRRACFDELAKRTDFVGTGDYEFEFLTECMEQKGYRLVKDDELPSDAKRQRPDTSLHWRAKGVAGSLE